MNLEDRFEFTSKEKRNLLILVGVGVLGLIIAFATGINHNMASRAWSNLLLNTYYFMGISLCGLVFIAMHQLGLSGWHNLFRRIPEAFGAYVPVMAVIMLVLIAGKVTGFHQLYFHHAHAHGTKHMLLNNASFAGILLIFIALWVFFSFFLRKLSISEDTAEPLSIYQKSKYWNAAFIMVFAVTSSIGSWLINMSLDPHWYSTLFGWYNFASYMVASLSFVVLIIIYLKGRGYLKEVNENHVHDIGKYIFGFSVFWAYLWFSQFMLIWYGNIPEDTIWFMKRNAMQPFATLMYVNVIINFAAPLLILMTRNSKRNMKLIGTMCVILIFGHYIDYFVMFMYEPNNIAEYAEYIEHKEHEGHDHGDHEEAGHGDEHSSLYTTEASALLAANTAESDAGDLLAEHHDGDDHGEEIEHSEEAHVNHSEDHAHEGDHGAVAHDDHSGHDAHGHGEEEAVTYAKFGLLEIMIFLGFIGGFLYAVFSALEKAPLMPQKNPYIKESIDHHVY